MDSGVFRVFNYDMADYDKQEVADPALIAKPESVWPGLIVRPGPTELRLIPSVHYVGNRKSTKVDGRNP